MNKLGYELDKEKLLIISPTRRKRVFVGDFTDHGSHPVGTLTLAMNIVIGGSALVFRDDHPGKPAHGLCKYEVNLSIQGIGYHFVETVSLFRVGGAYPPSV